MDLTYKCHYLSCADTAARLIEDEYELNRLEDLQRVRELQQSIQQSEPNISNLLLMAKVNVLFKTPS